jgi:hypothetical protein
VSRAIGSCNPVRHDRRVPIVLAKLATGAPGLPASWVIGPERNARRIRPTLVGGLGVGARAIKTNRRHAPVLSEVCCRIDLPSVRVPVRSSTTTSSDVHGTRTTGLESNCTRLQRAWIRPHDVAQDALRRCDDFPKTMRSAALKTGFDRRHQPPSPCTRTRPESCAVSASDDKAPEAPTTTNS